MTQAATLAQMGNTNQTFRNRIINGAMVIDQRNAGASVSATSPGYTLDRWSQYANAGSITVQRTTSVVPAGFSYAYSTTVGTANTRNATDYSFLYQIIEGLNVADLDLGLSTASTVTVSFWVRSSISGLYSGVLASGDNNRTYGFTYTINNANTWEQKTVTVAGDTSGGKTAYPIDNTAGLRLKLDLGSGSNYQATANAWTAATNKVGVSGTVNWAQTVGATFYITGVQLEAGTTATPFEYRQYGTELALCQRYYQILFGGPNNTSGADWQGHAGSVWSGAQVIVSSKFACPMRSAPTVALSSDAAGLVAGTNSTLNWTSSTVFTFYPATQAVGISVPTGSSFAAGTAAHVDCNAGRIYANAEL